MSTFHPTQLIPKTQEDRINEIIDGLMQISGRASCEGFSLQSVTIDAKTYNQIESLLFKTDGQLTGPNETFLVKKGT